MSHVSSSSFKIERFNIDIHAEQSHHCFTHCLCVRAVCDACASALCSIHEGISARSLSLSLSVSATAKMNRYVLYVLWQLTFPLWTIQWNGEYMKMLSWFIRISKFILRPCHKVVWILFEVNNAWFIVCTKFNTTYSVANDGDTAAVIRGLLNSQTEFHLYCFLFLPWTLSFLSLVHTTHHTLQNRYTLMRNESTAVHCDIKPFRRELDIQYSSMKYGVHSSHRLIDVHIRFFIVFSISLFFCFSFLFAIGSSTMWVFALKCFVSRLSSSCLWILGNEKTNPVA